MPFANDSGTNLQQPAGNVIPGPASFPANDTFATFWQILNSSADRAAPEIAREEVAGWNSTSGYDQFNYLSRDTLVLRASNMQSRGRGGERHHLLAVATIGTIVLRSEGQAGVLAFLISGYPAGIISAHLVVRGCPFSQAG
jgi:hypothetical protein